MNPMTNDEIGKYRVVKEARARLRKALEDFVGDDGFVLPRAEVKEIERVVINRIREIVAEESAPPPDPYSGT